MNFAVGQICWLYIGREMTLEWLYICILKGKDPSVRYILDASMWSNLKTHLLAHTSSKVHSKCYLLLLPLHGIKERKRFSLLRIADYRHFTIQTLQDICMNKDPHSAAASTFPLQMIKIEGIHWGANVQCSCWANGKWLTRGHSICSYIVLVLASAGVFVRNRVAHLP